MSKFKKGIMIPFFKEIPIVRRLELLKEAGFGNVILTLDRRHEKHIGKIEEVVKLCKKLNIGISSAHGPYTDYEINNFWLNNFKGDYIEKEFMTGLETEFGIIRLKIMVKFAQKNNTNIAIENLYDYEEIDFIFKKIKSPNIGLCYDSGHDNFLNPKNKNTLFQYENKIKCLICTIMMRVQMSIKHHILVQSNGI